MPNQYKREGEPTHSQQRQKLTETVFWDMWFEYPDLSSADLSLYYLFLNTSSEIHISKYT